MMKIYCQNSTNNQDRSCLILTFCLPTPVTNLQLALLIFLVTFCFPSQKVQITFLFFSQSWSIQGQLIIVFGSTLLSFVIQSDQISQYYNVEIGNMLAIDSIQKNYLYILFILSLAAESIVLVLFILLNALGFIGFDGGNPITATCTANYYQTKYKQINLVIRTAYIWTLLSLAAFSGAVVILVQCVLRAKGSQQNHIFISVCNKITMYVLAAVALLASIPAFGYYMSFLMQLGNCTYTYDSNYLNVIFAFSTISFALLLAVLILLFIFFAANSEEKYREVENNTTEPVERVEKIENVQHYKRPIDEPYKRNPETYERTPQEPQRNSPPRRVPNRGDQLEHTKENLYNSPPPNPKQPTFNIYSKQVDPQPLIRPIPIPQRRQQPAPLLEPRTYKKEVFQPENSRKAPSSNQGELIFSKSRHKGPTDDENDFAKQQNRFMSKYGARPILPSSGVQQVNREKRYNKDYFHEDLQAKPQQKSPSPKKGRDGNLLNYIRGKYGN